MQNCLKCLKVLKICSFSFLFETNTQISSNKNRLYSSFLKCNILFKWNFALGWLLIWNTWWLSGFLKLKISVSSCLSHFLAMLMKQNFIAILILLGVYFTTDCQKMHTETNKEDSIFDMTKCSNFFTKNHETSISYSQMSVGIVQKS